MGDTIVLNKNVIGEVLPGLFIGSLWSIKEIPKVRPHRKWTVVSILSSEKLINFANTTISEISDSHPDIEINHVVWELADKGDSEFMSEKLVSVLQDISNAIDTEGCCLVHCAFGVSRSATVCAAWILRTRRETALSASLDLIRRVRPEASPNMGFLANLRALEQSDGDVEQARLRLKRS